MARRRKGQPISGWVVLDKPLGMTSTQAVSAVRRLFDANKAGHGGTLDPLATGLLPIALGEATKTVPYVMDGRKIYRFTVRWGEARSTDDAEGPVTATSDRRPGQAEIEAVLPRFQGEIDQVPPAFSAIKVEGERAYDLARAGEAVDLAPRRVWIERLELVRQLDADHAEFEAETGKGVYMRSLARDLALALGDRRPCLGPAADRGRPLHGIPGDFSGIAQGPGAYSARLRAPVTGRGGAGRHPGPPLDRRRGASPAFWPVRRSAPRERPRTVGRNPQR
jgi:tRNA pseudouridine55 synthase